MWSIALGVVIAVLLLSVSERPKRVPDDPEKGEFPR